MAEDRKISIKAVLDATDVTAGLLKIETAGKRTSSSLSDGARQAGEAVSKIGDGSERSAAKVEASERRMEAAIKRRIAVLESAGKGERAYQEALISQRGYDTARFKPLLDQLDAAEKKASTARAALAGTTKTFNDVGMSAKQTAAALRGVPAQFTDIATAIAGGQAPMTVLLQQGGQLKDMFGGIVPAARALVGYIAGLINPFTLAAAGAGALAFAWMRGQKEAEAYNRALIMSGNAIGATAGQLSQMARSLSAVNGTQGAAAAALAELAGSSQVASKNLEQFAAVAIDMERTVGQSVAETRKQFDELGKSPLQALVQLNQGTNFLTASLYENVKALQEQGRFAEAAETAQRGYASAMADRTRALVENTGIIERAWKGVTGAAKTAWDAMLNVGRQASVSDQIASLDREIAKLSGSDRLSNRIGIFAIGDAARLDALRQQRAALLELTRLEEEGNAQRAESARRTQAIIEADKIRLQYATKQKQMEVEIAQARSRLQAAGAHDAEIAAIEQRIRDKHKEAGSASAGIKSTNDELRRQGDLLAKLSGLTTTFAEDWTRINSLFAAGKISREETLALQAELLAQQPAMRDAAKEEAEARKEAEKAAERQFEAQKKLIDQQYKMYRSAEAEINALKQSAEERGLSAEAVQRLRVARLNEADAIEIQRQSMMLMEATSAAEVAAIQRTIAALEKRQQLRTEGVEADIAKAERDEWQKSYADIERGLTDSLFRAAEAGKGFFESLRDSIRGMFNNLVLKPIVSAVMRPVAAALTGGFGSAANAATGGGSLMDIGSSLMSLGGNFNAGYEALFSKFAVSSAGQFLGLSAPLTEAMGGITGTAAAITGFGETIGSALPYLGSIAALAQGNYASAALSAIGTAIAGPIGAVIGSVVGSFIDGGGEKRLGSTYGYSASEIAYGQGLQGIWSDEVGGMLAAGQTRFIGGPSGGGIGGDALRQSVAATVGGINTLFDKLGSSERIAQFWGKLEQSEKGRGGVFAGGTLASGATFGESSWESGTSRTLSAEEAIQAFALDLQQSVVQALQAAADIPASITDLLRDVDAEALSQEQVGALLQTVEAIVAVTAALGTLGVQAASVTTAMLEAAGGAEALGAAAASYYQGYYSESERVGALAEQLAGQFAALGLEMPGTRDEFRALVESLDLTTAQGQSAYGTLLTLSDAFGVVADAAEQAAAEAARAAELQARAAEEAARAILEAQVSAVQGEMDGMVATFGDLEAAMRSLEPPTETLVDAWRRATGEIESLTTGIAQALGEMPASDLDRLRATTTSIANIGAALQGLDDQIMSLRAGTGDASALSALRGEESRLASELGSSSDPAAVAGRLAQITVQRIQLEARLQQDALQGRIDGLKEVADLERAARQDQIASLNDQIRAAGRLREIGESLTGLTAELQYGSLSALNPFARQDAASGEYQRILAAALGGDADAAGEFGGMARTYLSASQDMYGGSTGQYAEIFAEVLADAQRLGLDLSGADASAATAQLEALQAIEQYQAQAQQAVIDTSAEQIDALTAIREALIGRQDELRAQQAAQESSLRAQLDALQKLVEGQEAEIRQRAEAMAQLNARLDTLIAAQEGQARAAELEAASA